MIKLLSVLIAAGLISESNQQPEKLMPSISLKRCWTDWFDRDNPSGTGDWEHLSALRLANPGKICDYPISIEATTMSGTPAASTGRVFYKNDVVSGFICRNNDQLEKTMCHDYRVRFECPRSFCFPEKECWTDWFDRDNPSGTGDWEHLSALRSSNPGKICDGPLGIEATTLSGVPSAVTGDNIVNNDVTTGFVCKNLPSNYCADYRVRFKCPLDFCKEKECWTDWFDRDNPSGTGDWEHLSALRSSNPGKICDGPLGIEATTLSGVPSAVTGDNIVNNDVTTGFVCKNLPSNYCADYRVRFKCPLDFCKVGPVCWTNWFDRDNPSGTGDWEHLSGLKDTYPGQICETPKLIEAVTVSGNTPASLTGENFYRFSPTDGFVCLKSQQKDGSCLDYKVRFGCPC